MINRYAVQTRARRCMQNIVAMKQNLQAEDRRVFMKTAFRDAYESIRFDLMRKKDREDLKEEIGILVERFGS